MPSAIDNLDLVETEGSTDSSSDINSQESYPSTTSTDDDQPDKIDGKDKDDIAIIGLSLRFPGEATSADEFWKILMEARCTATKFPPERMNYDAFYSADPAAMGTVSLLLLFAFVELWLLTRV
jgi:hypothetical protein